MPFDNLKNHFIDFKPVTFWDGKDKKGYKDSLDIYNFAFLTSPKLHFGIVKRLKMISQYLATSRKNALSTSH